MLKHPTLLTKLKSISSLFHHILHVLNHSAHFSLCQVKLCIGALVSRYTNKSLQPKEGRKEGRIDRLSE